MGVGDREVGRAGGVTKLQAIGKPEFVKQLDRTVLRVHYRNLKVVNLMIGLHHGSPMIVKLELGLHY